MQQNRRTYNSRNQSRAVTNTFIKKYLKNSVNPQLIAPEHPELSIRGEWEGIKARYNSTIHLNEILHDDGTWELIFSVDARIWDGDCEVQLWEEEFCTDGYTLEECYMTVAVLMQRIKQRFYDRQQAVETTLITVSAINDALFGGWVRTW
jgi:hypothetical protein